MEHGRSHDIKIENRDSIQERACTLCGQVLDLLVLLYCPQYHPYCEICHAKLTSKKGNEWIFSCLMCKYDPEIKLTPNSSNQTVIISQNLPVTKQNLTINHQDPSQYVPCTSGTFIGGLQNEEETVFEKLIGLSKEHFEQSEITFTPQQRLQNPKSKLTRPSSSATISRRPIRCLHRMCHKPVTLAQFVNHFKCEHTDVNIFGVERDETFRLGFNIGLVEYDNPICLGMMSVYEINRMNFLKNPETSDKAIVKTCSKFCQTVPINTFWLFMVGSEEGRSSYAAFWLYTNSEEVHRCTLEVSSTKDTLSVTSCFQVSNATSNKSFLGLENRLDCLLVAKESLIAMLREGHILNLAVTIH